MRLSPRSSFKAVAFAALLLYSLVAAAKPAVTDLGRINRVMVEKSTGQANLRSRTVLIWLALFLVGVVIAAFAFSFVQVR